METRCINLNIHYSLPDEIWKRIHQLYTEMPHWRGYIEGIPQWYGTGEKLIEASSEPSGLQIYAALSSEEWAVWISLFKRQASIIVGYEVGEPEDGFDFVYY